VVADVCYVSGLSSSTCHVSVLWMFDTTAIVTTNTTNTAVAYVLRTKTPTLHASYACLSPLHHMFDICV